jgi:hypothetical protein
VIRGMIASLFGTVEEDPDWLPVFVMNILSARFLSATVGPAKRVLIWCSKVEIPDCAVTSIVRDLNSHEIWLNSKLMNS